MRKQWAVIAAVTFLTAGCGSGVDGVEVTGIPQERWDPCSIPADAIAGTGLDPGSLQIGWGDGIEMPGWERCNWAGPSEEPWYFYTVFTSGEHSLDDVRKNPKYFDITDVSLAGRHGIRFTYAPAGGDGECDAAFELSSGVATFAASTMGGLETEADLCELVIRHTSDLQAFFPAPR